jgi:hypothetical protein
MTAKQLWTPEAFAKKLQQLRSDGLSMEKAARILGCSKRRVFTALHPEKKSKPAPIAKAIHPKPKLRLPPHEFHGSCPIHRPLNSTRTKLPQLTHEQMMDDLRRAVRNTARLH